MQYLRSRQGKYVKKGNDKCPAKLQSKANAEPQRYFSMWLKAKKCWGTVELMENKKQRDLPGVKRGGLVVGLCPAHYAQGQEGR